MGNYDGLVERVLVMLPTERTPECELDDLDFQRVSLEKGRHGGVDRIHDIGAGRMVRGMMRHIAWCRWVVRVVRTFLKGWRRRHRVKRLVKTVVLQENDDQDPDDEHAKSRENVYREATVGKGPNPRIVPHFHDVSKNE